ncbi:caffeoylshikimate esterase-like [Senna tora]|uniref:Caffeoylshikimate esterase-like n=1 Tax=Senna tora TaxID=362788 RepID=A0A834U2F3_9FABA|nr:caffeoylshikimate esterase-like [Senna tora]
MESNSQFHKLTAVQLTKAEFTTCAIDHQGHGISDGLVAHILNINLVVDDCVSLFDSFRLRFDFDLPSFSTPSLSAAWSPCSSLSARPRIATVLELAVASLRRTVASPQ